MDLQLDGKTALVTGSSAGIGLAIARQLAAEGVRVTVVGRSRDKLDEAAATVAAEAPSGAAQSGVHAILADLATAGGAATVARQLPEVDILVNNLGIYEAKAFADIGDDDWRHFFEVNVLSGVRLARHYFPAMLKRNWGRIIFVASESALMVPPDMIHYGMTKTAQLAISRGLAGLTRGTRVTVNSVLPGPTRSEGIVDFLKSVARDPSAPAAELEAHFFVGSSRVDLQACKLEYSIVSPK